MDKMELENGKLLSYISELTEFITFTEFEVDETVANNFVWNHNRTLMFLDLYKQYRKQMGSLKIIN